MHRNSMKINYNIEFNVPACHPWLWMAAGRQLGLTCPIKCLMHVNFHIKCKLLFVIVGNIKSMWIVEKSMAERFNYEFVEWLTLLFEQQQILVGRHRDLMAQISLKYRNVNWFSVCMQRIFNQNRILQVFAIVTCEWEEILNIAIRSFVFVGWELIEWLCIL